jgi:hypothetical protein
MPDQHSRLPLTNPRSLFCQGAGHLPPALEVAAGLSLQLSPWQVGHALATYA